MQRAQSGAFDPTALLQSLQDSVPPWAQSALDRIGGGDFDFSVIRDRIVSLAQQLGQLIAGRALNLGQNTLRFVVATGIMLYVLFFLFRDGRGIARSILAAMPLNDRYNRRLLEKFVGVVRATVKGNIVIAVIQGTIGGATLWALGIDAALLWGALMVFLSLLPAVGAAIVWVPIAIYLFSTGAVWHGAVLVFVGGAVIGLVDNILRPILVGKDTRLPDYVILVSTVGGLSIFGINGFVIGPLIAALFVAAWTIFRDERDEVRRREALGPLILDGRDPTIDRPTSVIKPCPQTKRPALRRASALRLTRSGDQAASAWLSMARLARRSRSCAASAPRAPRARGRCAADRSRSPPRRRGRGRRAGNGARRRGWRCHDGGRWPCPRSRPCGRSPPAGLPCASMVSSSSAKPATARVIR